MEKDVEHKFELAGPHAGKSITLGGYPFVKGVMMYESKHEAEPGLTVYLARSFNAHPVGSEALAAAQAEFESGGEKPAPPIQAPNAPKEPAKSLADVIQDLDPEVDTNWNAQGTPDVGAVSRAYGKQATRADIDKAAPGFNRAAAKAAAALK